MDLFFRFPISLLASQPEDPVATLEGIIDWCTYDVGLKRWKELGWDNDVRQLAAKHAPKEYDQYMPEDVKECVACLGAAVLQTDRPRIGLVLDGYHRMTIQLDTNDLQSERNTVNIRREWAYSCIETESGSTDDRPLSWREFRVLSAILSKVGNKRHATCGWKEIQARAAGWSGKKIFAAAEGEERDRRLPLILSRDQIRFTLDRLEKGRFFARFSYARRETWFSFSCGSDRRGLAAHVEQVKTQCRDAVASNREDDRATWAQIRAKNGKPSALNPHPAAI